MLAEVIMLPKEILIMVMELIEVRQMLNDPGSLPNNREVEIETLQNRIGHQRNDKSVSVDSNQLLEIRVEGEYF